MPLTVSPACKVSSIRRTFSSQLQRRRRSTPKTFTCIRYWLTVIFSACTLRRPAKPHKAASAGTAQTRSQMQAGGTICEQDEASRRDQPMSVKAIYPRLAMMLTMAMPAMKRSALIMASVPLQLPSPMVPKKYGWVPLWISENSRIGNGFMIPPFSQRAPLGTAGQGDPWQGIPTDTRSASPRHL